MAGLVAVQLVLDQVSSHLGTGPGLAKLAAADGDNLAAGSVVAELSGPADTLLAAERTVLNLVTHLSGVATATASMVRAVAGTGAVVRDTRKTLPGLRAVEKIRRPLRGRVEPSHEPVGRRLGQGQPRGCSGWGRTGSRGGATGSPVTGP